MGEIKDILAQGAFAGGEIKIELNHPVTPNEKEKIHIQTNKFRYELSKQEFRLISSAFLSARGNIQTYKE